MNAVIYARFSSSAQREESIEGQIDVCTQYAKQHGYKIIDSYIDRAIKTVTGKASGAPPLLTEC